MKIIFLLLTLLITCPFSMAEPTTSGVEPLPVDQAFQFSATARDYQTILAMWTIAPGYYLYRARFHFQVIKPKDVTLGPALLPVGIQKTSPDIGHYQVYSQQLTIPLPIIQPSGKQLSEKQPSNKPLVLKVTYQGCAEEGFCYPPTSKLVTINLAGNYLSPITGVSTLTTTRYATQQLTSVEHYLKSKHWWIFVFGFFGFGILISLTPCVLPMIPILSGIIIGQKKMTHWHSFLLSLAYVIGMAATYAIAGIIFGYLGSSVQAAWQKPWIIVLFSLVFVALALSLFGLYEIKLPAKIANRLAHASDKQKPGTYIGAFIMGIFSTLILSPCVTPPLVGVLGYISQTGDAAIGGIALFTMGIGMGLPLLLIGGVGPKLLPKSGVWMNTMKGVMGLLLLAVSIWMLQRIISGELAMLLWAALAIGASLYFGALSTANTTWEMLKKGIGLLFFIYGIILIIGVTTGNTNPLKPLHSLSLRTTASSLPTAELHFIPVKTVADVTKQLNDPNHKNKWVMLDFYADWCIACKEMDAFTFSNAAVQKRLKHMVLLRADVTANDQEDKMLSRYFNVVAPPSIIFFDKQHNEIKNTRIIGELSAEKFLTHLDHLTTLKKGRNKNGRTSYLNKTQ